MGRVDPERERLLVEIYEAANRGDLEALVRRLAADVEWWTPTRTIRGRDAVAGWLSGWQTSYHPQHSPEELIDVGDHVLALVSISYEGREENRPAHVWTITEGRVSRVQVFQMRERAYEALDMEPPA